MGDFGSLHAEVCCEWPLSMQFIGKYDAPFADVCLSAANLENQRRAEGLPAAQAVYLDSPISAANDVSEAEAMCLVIYTFLWIAMRTGSPYRESFIKLGQRHVHVKYAMCFPKLSE